MTILTEQDIFDRMTTSFREAIDAADKLAVSPRTGPAYRLLREHLGLIEGACRQAAAWRGDTRWLPMGIIVHECHNMAGRWLRGAKDQAGQRISLAPGQRHVAFSTLANMLKKFHAIAEKYRTDKVHRTGLILPETTGVDRYVPNVEQVNSWKQ